MCLTGIMNVEPQFDVDATDMNRAMVLRNLVLFGTVNAGRRHWEQAVDALAAGRPGLVGAMITRRVPLDSLDEALDRRPDDIKVVVDLTHDRPQSPPGADPRARALSEGPRWHEERQELLWVDILGRQLHRGTLAPTAASTT